MKKNILIEIITILYVILFLYTGISKLLDYNVFKEQIATSPMLAPISSKIAWLLPWVEFLAILLLIVPRWRLKGLYTSLVLMIIFTIYIISILAFNKNIPCSCGGVIELLSWKAHIIFNGMYMILALLGISLEKSTKIMNRITLSSNLIILILSISLIIGISGCLGKEPEKTGHEGKPMPSFKLLLSDSSTWLDTKDIPNDKPIVLFYFGPHCPYSRAQMEEIIKEINIFKNVRFYAFTSWPFNDMKNFYTHYHLSNYPSITMGIDNRNFFGKYFEAKGVPYIAIYGKEKRLKEAFIGQMNGKQIRDLAEE